MNRDKFRHNHNQFDPGIDGFQKSVQDKRSGNEIHRSVGPGFPHGLRHTVENRKVFDGFSPFAGRHPTDNAGPGSQHPFCLDTSDPSGDALNDYARIFIKKYGHFPFLPLFADQLKKTIDSSFRSRFGNDMHASRFKNLPGLLLMVAQRFGHNGNFDIVFT